MTVALTNLADVEAEQVSWLWPERIPAGKIVTLDGDPGLGKSTLALAIAAAVTTGGEWPDGTRCPVVGDVLIMSAEDGLADTIKPRLDAAAADLTRVHTLDGRREHHDTIQAVTLANVETIREAITDTGARLLIVDVLEAFLTGDAHKNQDVRRILGPISQMADTTGCTVLLVRHLNKNKATSPIYRGGGSIGIVGAARTGMAVIADPDDPEVRVLTWVKNNLAPMGPSMAFTIVPARVGGVDTSRVEWSGEDVRTAAELFAVDEAQLGDKSGRVLQIVNRLGAVKTGDVAAEMGISPKDANQYLTRLAVRGHIRKGGRGVYAAKSSSATREDGEDCEDYAAQGVSQILTT